jgi:hypothetical protein
MQLQFCGRNFVANRYGMDPMHMVVRPNNLPNECCQLPLPLAGASILFWNVARMYDYCE